MSARTGVVFAAIALALGIGACSQTPKPAREQNAASSSIEEQAWDAVKNGAPLIDVRTDAEFAAGHLPGAVLIPYDQIASRVIELPADKNQTIVLYCRTGRRSGIAKQELEGLGFTRVINAGGYEEMLRAQPR